MTRQQSTSNSSADEGFVIKQPLRLYREKRRRYVRLEISAPITFSGIDLDRPLEHTHVNQQNGTILNISGGGVLIACQTDLAEGGYITMNLELTGCDLLTGVAGKVKRVDEDGEGGYLIGVEFCSEPELNGVFGSANIGSVISSFDNRIRRFLLRYIFARKVSERINKKDRNAQKSN
jgi:c-di-GMP-binding flagellar brake protein YcgR